MTKGQHLRVKRPSGWIADGMFHHGIDLGDSTVIHFTGLNKRDAKVIRTNINVFESNGQAQVVDYDKIRKMPPRYFGDELIDYSQFYSRHPDEIVGYALQSLGYGNYHPYTNNCEHFATCMVTGVRFSIQSENVYSNIDRRPTLGGLLANFLIEWLRFHNPRAKAVDERQYVGSAYQYDNQFFLEWYDEAGKVPPAWFMSQSASGPWSEIDQRVVPYPLSELVRYFVDKAGRHHIESSEEFTKI
jgi:hypothetical protein